MKPCLAALILMAVPGVFPVLSQNKPPIADNPVVDVKGAITKVQLVAGQGMPFVEVKTSQGTVKLYLGAMRYLMQENFNPKAGEAVEAKGYKMNEQGVVAIRVDLPDSKKSLKLRDENGWPLWMGGRHMGPPPK
jgi:hypothetical protein